MEEKRYPILDKEESVGMASEPIMEPMPDAKATLSGSIGVPEEETDWIDDLDWSRFPSLGPFSEEETIARIDRFEERLAKGEVKWYSSEEVDKLLYEKYPWLR